MATLDELVFYCKMKEPAGALALVGESGSGKSHLVDTDLTEALRDSHVIIRVYPRFSPKYLFASVRQWIHESFWDKELFLRELEAVQGKPFPAQPEASGAPPAATAG